MSRQRLGSAATWRRFVGFMRNREIAVLSATDDATIRELYSLIFSRGAEARRGKINQGVGTNNTQTGPPTSVFWPVGVRWPVAASMAKVAIKSES